jgi:hypothetical protein
VDVHRIGYDPGHLALAGHLAGADGSQVIEDVLHVVALRQA